MANDANAARAAEIVGKFTRDRAIVMPGYDLIQAITAALDEARRMALEEALAKVRGEHLEDPNPDSETDEAYDRAISDAAAAIRALLAPAAQPEGEK